MNRITRKDLYACALTLNEALRMPVTYSATDGSRNSNPGHYTISCAYGGYSLHQVCDTSGGIRDVFNCGHVAARDLYNRIRSMMTGIEAKQ